MNLTFTNEQEELRRTVKRFLDSKSPEAAVRQLMVTEHGYDKVIWSQMAEQLGLQSLIIPEEYDGSGAGFTELIVVLEEMGRRLACTPFFSTVVLAASTLIHSRDNAAQSTYLPRIASGEITATLAFTEPSGRWDETGITATASPTADGWALTGIKSYVLDGHIADLLIVAARTPNGVTLFTVDPTSPGVERTLLSTLDQTRKQARIVLTGVPGTVLGDEGDGWPILSVVLDRAAVALAAEQVGGAQQCLDMAVDYAKLRVQFGRPIGSFQSIKHKCADLLVEIESAKSAAYHAADCADNLTSELPVAASVAKAYCSDAYSRAAADNIQIHGGIGFTWEHPAHLYYRRAKSSESFLGSPVIHRERLASAIGLGPRD